MGLWSLIQVRLLRSGPASLTMNVQDDAGEEVEVVTLLRNVEPPGTGPCLRVLVGRAADALGPDS